METPTPLSPEDIVRLSSKEIVNHFVGNLTCRELAGLLAPHRTDGSGTFSTKQAQELKNGVFSTRPDSPHQIAFVRFAFPNDQATQNAVLEKMRREGNERLKKGSRAESGLDETKPNNITVARLTVRMRLCALLASIELPTEVRVEANSSGAEANDTVLVLRGPINCVRLALKEIVKMLPEDTVSSYVEE